MIKCDIIRARTDYAQRNAKDKRVRLQKLYVILEELQQEIANDPDNNDLRAHLNKSTGAFK